MDLDKVGGSEMGYPELIGVSHNARYVKLGSCGRNLGTSRGRLSTRTTTYAQVLWCDDGSLNQTSRRGQRTPTDSLLASQRAAAAQEGCHLLIGQSKRPDL